MNGKRIVFSMFGSFGDVHPYIAIALELKKRGHQPLIATTEVYREKMSAAGIEFYPVRPDMPSYDQPDELGRLVEQALNQKEGPEAVTKLITPHLHEIYADLDGATEDADLLVTHPLPLVGPVVAQKKKMRWVSSVLAPASFLSVYDPIVPPQLPALYKLMRLSPLVGRAVMKLATLKLDKLMQPVYDLRAKLSLPRGEQPIMKGQHSPTRVLALFSRLLAAPQPDWPANTTVTGFPFYDRRDFFGESRTSPELLEFLDSGPAPIVFTLGSSAFWVARDFYRDSIAAAQALGRRALLLIGHARNLPPLPLPNGVAAFEYAPYSEVLPRACAIVHQGGVGTTGQAMRSGRPVLIVPHAHDQFDNAARVARLGCGLVLPRPRYNPDAAIRRLRSLLEKPGYAESAVKVAEVVRAEDGACAAADEIEHLFKAENQRAISNAAGH